MSTQIQQSSPEMEAAASRLIKLHLEVSSTYLSLSIYFEGNGMALSGAGRFFRALAKEKQEGAQLLLKMLKAWGDDVLVQGGQTLSPEKWNTSVDAMESAMALEKSLNQALLDLHALGRASADAQLCQFLECCFLKEEMMLLKKMGDHLSNLRKITSPQAGLQAGLNEYLFKKLSFQRD
ncbi:ferritin light chain-like [Moschus berezovskii]|uniref:ferritin light chain-like n=1 Tax=Moschus berezovskii TaxID=68408 RepID=UPI0024437994|nr:ferritin light chain-like [Moschus berezovskii]